MALTGRYLHSDWCVSDSYKDCARAGIKSSTTIGYMARCQAFGAR